MFAIMSNGALVSLCEQPRYVKQSETGVYIEATAAEAIGVSVNGNLYNINGGNNIPDAPEATIAERDGSEFVFKNRARIEKNEAETGAAIISIEDALCEMDTAENDNMAAIEDALCEIDSRANGGE